ncbi:hypothetical protein SCACP_40030 [Sporomusa carbonis]|uniref:ATP-binding protein n=1 Tax=Sporomusa carbonis TaxID=3076075 RepID=UPI003A6F9AA8
MSLEGQLIDKKSIRAVTGKTADWTELAKDCVAFATAQGGKLLIGIEDNADLPPADQRVDVALLDTIRKKISERTVNVAILPAIVSADNGGQYIELVIQRSLPVPSTSDGRYYIRVADSSKPVIGDEILRLASERSALPWETLTTHQVPRSRIDNTKKQKFCTAIRASDRVKLSVKEKTDDELLEHYMLARDQYLTNLGILCLGRREDRAQLGVAPVIQYIKYDETGQKVNKIAWDDFSLSPIEMLEAVWNEVPDWRESYEYPDGLYRQKIPHYDEVVVRELLTNALVHRPYTQRGDIFIKLYPDRLQIVNPGTLPLGVTPRNILHTTIRRNEHLAKVFHDLKLMEREGSGYDMVYEVLLAQGKQLPEIAEGPDHFEVTIRKRIFNPRIIDFIAKADSIYQLNQREKICLGLLAQNEAMSAFELCKSLELPDATYLKPWLDKLVQTGIVQSSGRTKGTMYHVSPELIKRLDFKATTTLKDIEVYRLQELVLKDLSKYGRAKISDIHNRIGKEIPRRRLQTALAKLVDDGVIGKQGGRKATAYVWLGNL